MIREYLGVAYKICKHHTASFNIKKWHSSNSPYLISPAYFSFLLNELINIASVFMVNLGIFIRHRNLLMVPLFTNRWELNKICNDGTALICVIDIKMKPTTVQSVCYYNKKCRKLINEALSQMHYHTATK